MSDAADEGRASMLVPSSRFSGWLFLISCLGILLWLLNILQMATPTGDKVVWASILSIGLIGGDYMSSNSDFRIFSDGIFIILCLFVNILAFRGIMANVDGGIKGWLINIKDDFWPSLVDAKHSGIRKTVSRWSMLIGIVFYFGFGLLESAWVDPGVYSVSAPFVVFGWAFGKLADAQFEESNEN